MNYDCIVLGAGIAGLAATRRLAEAGRQVLLLESQGHVGGRMRTLHTPGLQQPVELGAEFIHGRPPELLKLLEEAGLSITETEGTQLCFDHGTLTECPEYDPFWDLLEGMQQVADDEGDMTVDAYLARTSAPTGAPQEAQQRLRNYVEGFNAADASVIGIAGLAAQQAAEDAIEGDRAARVDRGYQALAEYVRDRALAAGAHIILQAKATQITWSRQQVSVIASDGRGWDAQQLICALPLGVLQSGNIAFSPAPKKALSAASQLRAGEVRRLVLHFENDWWASRHPHMRFLFTREHIPATWWTTAPVASPLLTAWIGGPRARPFHDAAALVQKSFAVLEQVFHSPGNQAPSAHSLRGAYQHDWQADPNSLGAYSYAPAGAAGSSAILAEPIDDTLYFAGEHTDTTGHPGTVHGALGSGFRAAEQVLSASSARP
jgi:monoamine oxidase